MSTNPDDSHVIVSPDGTTWVGNDGTRLFAAITLKAALNLYARSGIKMASRVTPTAMLASATTYTGTKYKRGQYAEAAEDMRVWIETMKAAMPVVRQEDKP